MLPFLRSLARNLIPDFSRMSIPSEFYSGFLSYVHSPAFYADKKAARSPSPLPFLGRSAGLYPASLFHLLSRKGVFLLPAEDEDLTITEDFRGLSPALP